MSRPARIRTTAAVALALVSLAFAGTLPAGADAPTYCRTEEGLNDPRCKPDYCQTPEGEGDPYCWDPRYCETYSDDPICQKGDPEPKKETCVWYVDGAPVGGLVPIIRQADPGPHAVRLDCPNHELADWTCVAKGRDETTVPTTGIEDPLCTYHGATVDPFTCAATFAWTVMVPDFNTWTVELRATTYKVKPAIVEQPLVDAALAGCVGPLDWNTSEVVTRPDGSLGIYCVLENQFLAKDFLFKQKGMWHHYSEQDGTFEYHTHPNMASLPDGKIDECDFQHYSIQWRQWN